MADERTFETLHTTEFDSDVEDVVIGSVSDDRQIINDSSDNSGSTSENNANNEQEKTTVQEQEKTEDKNNETLPKDEKFNPIIPPIVGYLRHFAQIIDSKGYEDMVSSSDNTVLIVEESKSWFKILYEAPDFTFENYVRKDELSIGSASEWLIYQFRKRYYESLTKKHNEIITPPQEVTKEAEIENKESSLDKRENKETVPFPENQIGQFTQPPWKLKLKPGCSIVDQNEQLICIYDNDTDIVSTISRSLNWFHILLEEYNIIGFVNKTDVENIDRFDAITNLLNNELGRKDVENNTEIIEEIQEKEAESESFESSFSPLQIARETIVKYSNKSYDDELSLDEIRAIFYFLLQIDDLTPQEKLGVRRYLVKYLHDQKKLNEIFREIEGVDSKRFYELFYETRNFVDPNFYHERAKKFKKHRKNEELTRKEQQDYRRDYRKSERQLIYNKKYVLAMELIEKISSEQSDKKETNEKEVKYLEQHEEEFSKIEEETETVNEKQPDFDFENISTMTDEQKKEYLLSKLYLENQYFLENTVELIMKQIESSKGNDVIDVSFYSDVYYNQFLKYNEELRESLFDNTVSNKDEFYDKIVKEGLLLNYFPDGIVKNMIQNSLRERSFDLLNLGNQSFYNDTSNLISATYLDRDQTSDDSEKEQKLKMLSDEYYNNYLKDNADLSDILFGENVLYEQSFYELIIQRKKLLEHLPEGFKNQLRKSLFLDKSITKSIDEVKTEEGFGKTIGGQTKSEIFEERTYENLTFKVESMMFLFAGGTDFMTTYYRRHQQLLEYNAIESEQNKAAFLISMVQNDEIIREGLDKSLFINGDKAQGIDPAKFSEAYNGSSVRNLFNYGIPKELIRDNNVIHPMQFAYDVSMALLVAITKTGLNEINGIVGILKFFEENKYVRDVLFGIIGGVIGGVAYLLDKDESLDASNIWHALSKFQQEWEFFKSKNEAYNFTLFINKRHKDLSNWQLREFSSASGMSPSNRAAINIGSGFNYNKQLGSKTSLSIGGSGQFDYFPSTYTENIMNRSLFLDGDLLKHPYNMNTPFTPGNILGEAHFNRYLDGMPDDQTFGSNARFTAGLKYGETKSFIQSNVYFNYRGLYRENMLPIQTFGYGGDISGKYRMRNNFDLSGNLGLNILNISGLTPHSSGVTDFQNGWAREGMLKGTLEFGTSTIKFKAGGELPLFQNTAANNQNDISPSDYASYYFEINLGTPVDPKFKDKRVEVTLFYRNIGRDTNRPWLQPIGVFGSGITINFK